MLSFVAATAGLMIDPVILAGGILAGYLFHIEMRKLAFGLLLFVLPAVPTLWAVHPGGMFLGGLAQLLAASAIAAAACWFLETLKMRPRRARTDG
jgi:hypothetical protein